MFSRPTRRSGFSYSALLERRLAAQWAGYRWPEFEACEIDEQAACIAAYRVTNQIRAIEAYEQEREMKAAQRKRGKK